MQMERMKYQAVDIIDEATKNMVRVLLPSITQFVSTYVTMRVFVLFLTKYPVIINMVPRAWLIPAMLSIPATSVCWGIFLGLKVDERLGEISYFIDEVFYKIFKSYGLVCILGRNLIDTDYVTRLIRSGVDVNIQNKFGDTPLLLACKKGMESIANRLIFAGAKVNVENDGGYSPLRYACEKGLKSTINELVGRAKVEGEDLVNYLKMSYVQNDSDSLVVKLIENGVNFSRVFDEENEKYGRILIEKIDKNLNKRINKLNRSINKAYTTLEEGGYKKILEGTGEDLVRMNNLLDRLKEVKASWNLVNEFKDVWNKRRNELSSQTIFYMNAWRCNDKAYHVQTDSCVIPECVTKSEISRASRLCKSVSGGHQF